MKKLALYIIIILNILFSNIYALGDQGDLGSIGGVPEPVSTSMLGSALVTLLLKKKLINR